MARTLEFFFDIVSPTAYLAWFLAPGTAERAGADMVLRPMFLGGVMQGTGNQPPGRVPAKGAYLGQDLQRCARYHGLPFHSNPAFPFNTLPILRAAHGLADDPEMQRALLDAAFRHAWGQPEPKDLGDPEARAAMYEAEGLDGSRLEALAGEAANKDSVKATTEEAVSRGVFGAPTFFVGDEMFFGHDRLDYAERALKGEAPPA